MNDAVRAVLDAGVTLLSSELEGARLSDAFLAMTEAA
jgi:ABC-2 type transport system ATP-binding protein